MWSALSEFELCINMNCEQYLYFNKIHINKIHFNKIHISLFNFLQILSHDINVISNLVLQALRYCTDTATYNDRTDIK